MTTGRFRFWAGAGAVLGCLTLVALVSRDWLPWVLTLDGLVGFVWLCDAFLGYIPIPTRRWFTVAFALAPLALFGLVQPGAWWPLVLANGAWFLALMVDTLRMPDPRVLTVAREAPPAFSVGRALPVTYTWSNRSTRRLRLLVREERPEPLGGRGVSIRSITVEPGARLREVHEVRPARRGKGRTGGFDLRIAGPWGLAWRQERLELPWAVTVYPNLVGASVRALPTQATRRREAGFRNVRRLGEGRVFETLKEWVPGEDTRTIDWKATARRGKVMARQYEDERRQQVLIVIDAGRGMTAEAGGTPRLEAAIDAALQLAHSAVEHDDNVGLMVFADTVQTFVPPGRGRRALRAVLDGLAAAEGRVVEPNYPAAFSELAARNRKRALTVLFTDVIDRTASEALVAQMGSLRPRHLPLAVTLRDPDLEHAGTHRPDTVAQAYERAAAEELLMAREEALAEMRRKGVLTLDVPPGRAADAVVEQYTQLKRRGML